MKSIFRYITPLVGLMSLAHGITINPQSQSSTFSAMSSIAYDMMTYYSGNQTGKEPGILPGPCASTACYYWWEAGAMWAALINYWQYTGDSSYNPTVIQSLQYQVGPNKNYNPPSQSKNMGVDDQDFWAFAAMEAVEAGLPDVGDGSPSWLSLAQAVFNFQVPLWDTAVCGGGFRWQVFAFNAGYNLKNTISNGGFFQLAARLARYTGNSTYADWADKVYDWMAQSPLLEPRSDGHLYIWDNTDSNNNCSDVEHYVWTYNYGTMLMGSAMMYNYTNGSAVWKSRIDAILEGADFLFFPSEYGGNIMTEMLCEKTSNCNNDQSSFKAYLSRWMAVTSLIAPYTAATIAPKLAGSAVAAGNQCIGGSNGRMCGRQWYNPVWDGSMGVGQQMCALAVIGATQIKSSMAPLTANTGGTSVSNPSAGSEAPYNPADSYTKITSRDKTGAIILTVTAIAFIIGLCVWIVL